MYGQSTNGCHQSLSWCRNDMFETWTDSGPRQTVESVGGPHAGAAAAAWMLPLTTTTTTSANGICPPQRSRKLIAKSIRGQKARYAAGVMAARGSAVSRSVDGWG